MPGNIQGVNLQKLRSEIDEYEKVAGNLQGSLYKIESSVGRLRNYWTGKRINQVINLWNDKWVHMTDDAHYFSGHINIILNEIYEQYVSMEQGEPKNANHPETSSIARIPLTDEANIKFDKVNVEKEAKNIETEINNANSYLNQLVTQLDSMQTYSDSLKTLGTRYKNSANSIQHSLTELCNTIKTELNDAISDVNTTEGYNEDDAKRAGTTSQGGNSAQ